MTACLNARITTVCGNEERSERGLRPRIRVSSNGRFWIVVFDAGAVGSLQSDTEASASSANKSRRLIDKYKCCFAQASYCSRRFSSFCNRNLSPKAIWVNSTPRPSPGMMSRTTASARTLPPGTSKASLIFVPTGGGSVAAMNKPPMPSVLTREKSWRSPPYQLTGIPFGSEMRGYRRVGRVGSPVTNCKAFRTLLHQRTS